MAKKGRSIEAIIEELPAKQRAGLEIGGEAVDSSYSPGANPSETAPIGHLKDAEVGRGKTAVRFVAEDDPNEFWSMGDDRIIAGADLTYSKSVIDAMVTGHICIRCQEWQDDPYPRQCSLCGYAMQDLQQRDFALEFRGGKHLGPSLPISEYANQMEEEAMKKRFVNKIKAGASRMTGLRGRGT